MDNQLDTTVDDVTTSPEPEVVAPTQTTLTNTDYQDRNADRVNRMGQVVTKFASTLCLRNIGVKFQNNINTSAPAWSDSDNIYFNTMRLGDISSPKIVTAIKGLSLHEISHILLTPRVGANLSVWVKEQDYWRAFNALEDQRIEHFMTNKYSNVSDWLVVTIAQYLLDNKEAYEYSFPLLHGRKYLPQEIRDAVRGMYSFPEDIQELSSLIDEYILLNLADSTAIPRAKEIIEKYHNLVNGANDWNKIKDPNAHSVRAGGELKSSGTSKPMSKAEQQAIIDKIKKGQLTIVKSDKKPDGTNNNSSPVTLVDAIEITQQVYSEKLDELSEQIDDAMKQYNGTITLKGSQSKPIEKASWYLHNVPPEVVSSSRSFSSELEMLKGEYDPGWNVRQQYGRLNIQRYVAGCDVEEAFDQWDLGREDAVDIEAVVLLDTSPSMQWTLESAFDSMWAIKRALDKIHASTTVITYDNKTKLLYSSEERADYRKRLSGVGGGTEPLDAILYAKNILGNSDRAIKVLITITDGVWSSSAECDQEIKMMRRAGVLTALAYVDDTEFYNEMYEKYGMNKTGVTSINTHGCEVTHKVNNASELFGLARSIVKAGVRRNLANV